MHLPTNWFRLLCCLSLAVSSSASARASGRATILYDAFGNSGHLKKDWGFSVVIEYAGKKILFDTGNDARIFASNAHAMDVDLNDLDFVVISHRHGDHTSGLNHLLKVKSEGQNLRSSGVVRCFWKCASQGVLQNCEYSPGPHALFRWCGTQGVFFREPLARRK